MVSPSFSSSIGGVSMKSNKKNSNSKYNHGTTKSLKDFKVNYNYK